MASQWSEHQRRKRLFSDLAEYLDGISYTDKVALLLLFLDAINFNVMRQVKVVSATGKQLDDSLKKGIELFQKLSRHQQDRIVQVLISEIFDFQEE
jgi:hypothetical protein